MARGFLETAAAGGGEHVVGAPADGFGAQPFLMASRKTEVRIRRSLSSSGSSRRIRLPSQMQPPRGGMASPKAVMINEPAWTRRCWRKASRRCWVVLLTMLGG